MALATAERITALLESQREALLNALASVPDLKGAKAWGEYLTHQEVQQPCQPTVTAQSFADHNNGGEDDDDSGDAWLSAEIITRRFARLLDNGACKP